MNRRSLLTMLALTPLAACVKPKTVEAAPTMFVDLGRDDATCITTFEYDGQKWHVTDLERWNKALPEAYRLRLEDMRAA